MPDVKDLRLAAEDATDLEVISAALQDAVTHVRDLAFLPSTRRFACVVNRFRWEGEGKSRKQSHERVRTGLHFDNVLSARARNISQDRPDGVLNLLAIRFDELNAPSGIVTLVFSGGAEVQLEVEALDAHLSDLGLVWETPNKPAHDLD
ncbi:DUF2948 family protein [Parvibaculum sp.]|jgi:hypothetical protein|uniref:DUF2948 family protein n=1 Tax=Parvibaculum sp. TaxID=2024848 RepID=UPI000C61B70D|nr:DUF2948 family protein [Parvibaculum sp.]MAM95729.1 hypothetical protein [Parvibaculum sp.]HCX66097.1 DUF2948 domain-containing protein [Rhodobiaceae bacterium]|tara:strand:- start:10779 stop:11225 length:447 start_codon:yes stop_codon:yes gene_type:complete